MDNEIKCPSCGQVFKVDESGYASILKQVRDHEFEEELKAREQKDLALAKMEQEKEYQDALAKKAAEINEMEKKIEQLKAQISNAQTEKELAVTKATQVKDQELSEKNNEIVKLKGDLDLQKKEGEIQKSNLEEKHRNEIAIRDEEIERLKDFKARQSTKMVGESLEQHCMNQFNQIRMAAFPNAEFGKDNDASSGSKGDFIYRESSDGVEFISIMFEMKNEMDTTATKHKNEDFFAKLDSDRKKKGCEFAVLVSMLEPDSELYNGGIVDVSYRYEKMYVIRPQFFLPMITLLCQTSRKSLEAKRELELAKAQQVDVTNFEAKLADFQDKFGKHVLSAHKNYEDAIKSIDASIKNLERVKDALTTSANQLRLANNNAMELTIKRLTQGNPTMRDKFEEAKNA
jgi:hypothetical protein